MNKPRFTIDFETRSEADLKKLGAFKYSMHPSTQVICLCWQLDDGPIHTLKIDEILEWPKMIKFWDKLSGNQFFDTNDFEISAHNAFFETVIYNNVLVRRYGWPKIDPRRWRCTAAKAASHALPRNLEGAAMSLGLPVQKDMQGRALIMKYCRPTQGWKKWETYSRDFPDMKEPEKWHNDPKDFERIYEYCRTDVKAERLLDKRLPDLNTTEQDVWFLDQKMNLRGVYVDIPSVKKILNLISIETKSLKKEVDHLSYGLIDNATQRNAVLEWLRAEGIELENLQAKTVDDVLKEGKVSDDAKRMLEIRKAISKTSTAKYEAFLNRAGEDSRVRDILLYHAASTGRWGGMGIQPQNFPKGLIDNTDYAIDFVCDSDLELIRLMYGDPMVVFSSCLRGMITATPGHELFCADYSAIEARVLFWVAKHELGLKMYHQNENLYLDMAFEIFNNKNLTKKNKVEYDLGKRAILGCGYGMGWKKFMATCEQYNQPVDEKLAKRAVEVYREKHSPVVDLWKAIERAAIMAVKTKKVVKVNRTCWFVERGFLYCQLPSGRRLAYPGPKIGRKETPWGEMVDVLSHLGVNSLTKKWGREETYGGRLVENICQSVARDLMAEAMIRVEQKGYPVLMSVHDELVSERKIGDGGTYTEFEKLMAELPPWAVGCPVAAEGWSGPRYKK